MPAFYISNIVNKVNDIKIFKKYFKECKVIKVNDISLNLFYNENDSSFVELGKDCIFNIGVFIYRNEWNGNALQLFLEDYKKENNLAKLLNKTRGQFCLVLYYKKKVYVITDKTGATPIYCYKNGDTIEISNIFLPLAKNNNISLNYTWIEQYLSQGNIKEVYYFDKNIANEISILDCGSIHAVNKNICQTKYYDICIDLEIGKYKDPEEVINTTKKILSNNLSFLKNDDKIYCDITGGFDTRTNLAVLMHNNIKFNFGNQIPTEYKHLTNRGKYSDLAITKKIADQFNLYLYTYTDTKFKPEREKYSEMAYDFLNTVTDWIHSRRLGYYNYTKDNLKNKILICGLYGGELLTQCIYRCAQSHENFDIDKFLHRYYPYCDIIKDEYYSEKKYYNNLKTVFANILNNIYFQNFNDAETYIQYLTSYRTFCSKYHGIANAIIPTYSPYVEANFMRFMIQTSCKLKSRYLIQRSIISELNPELGNIETSHGYPATKITFKNFYKFIRIFYPWEPHLQYIGPPRRLIGFLCRKLLGVIILNSKIHNFATSIYGYITHRESWCYLYGSTSTNSLALDQIEKSFKKMPVFKIIDKDKFKKRIKRDYLLIKKINNLNQLLSDIYPAKN